MKKIFLILLINLLGFIELSAQLPSINGSNRDNFPTVVKTFNDGIYVASYDNVGSQPFARFTKFNLTTGQKIWEKFFQISTRIEDFDYNPVTDELVLVGHTRRIHDGTDNFSFWAVFTGAGTLVTYNFSNYPGSEYFRRILRHPNTNFYILGSKNPTATPSSNDVVVLYELNGTTYNLNWSSAYVYTTTPTTDDEFTYGMFLYGNDVMLTGTVIGNDGALVQIDVSTRNVVRSFIYPNLNNNKLDIYDGIDLGGGYLAIVGEDFTLHQAFIQILTPSLGTAPSTVAGTGASLRFQNITNFKDVWTDASGNLYTIGEDKNLSGTGKNYQVVHKFTKSVTPSNSTIALSWARYLSDLNEVSFGEGKICVTPANNGIYYVDNRVYNISNFGGKDLLVGAYNLNLDAPTSSCTHPITSPFDRWRIAPSPILVTQTPLSLPTIMPQTGFNNQLTMNLTSFCVTPTCDFSVALTDCVSSYQFTATPMPAGTYSYVWDIGCDGAVTPDITTTTPVLNYTFPCGGGTYQVCLKIKTTSLPSVVLCESSKAVVVPNGCCGTIGVVSAECTKTPCLFTFSIAVDPPPGLPNCVPTLVFNNSTPNTTPSYTVAASGTGGWVITGGSSVPCNNVPQNLSYTVNFNCICPTTGLPIACSLPVIITTPCCKPIQVGDQTVCETMPNYDVPILPLYWGSYMNITSVTWYVLPKPVTGCPTPPWTGIGATPYQVTTGNVLEPLHLYPANLTGDVCVYAVVTLNDGNCTVLTSNVASITRCKPSSYALTNAQYCYAGTPVTPNILGLTVTPTPACSEVVTWLDPSNNPIAGSTGSYTYQPPALSMTNPTLCYQDFIYTMRITDDCGVRNYPTRVRLFSSTASIGTLAIDPLEPVAPMTLLCNGEDLTLTFIPNCASLTVPSPPTWSWYKRDCTGGVAGPIIPLPTAGTMNGVYNTNKLTKSTWFGVTAANGVCPAKSVEKLIEVKNLTVINDFKAVPDACLATSVVLKIKFTPCTLECTNGTCTCNYEVTWYKDGVSIGTTTTFTIGGGGDLVGSLNYTTQPLAGNYYAVLKTCCNEILTTSVVTVTPTCKPKINGPCFICRNTPVVLAGEMVLPVNQPCPYGANCTFLWSVVAGTTGVISGSTGGATVTVTAAGTYQLTTTCTTPYGTCVQTAQFVLSGCTNSSLCSCPSSATPKPNMILNGDFSLGNFGFVSGLVNNNTNTCSAGSYNVITNFNAFCSSWGSLTDHTLPTSVTGKFLAIDAKASGVPTVLWRSAPVYLTNQTNYCFSFWWASVHPTSTQSFSVEVDIVNATNGAIISTVAAVLIEQTPHLTWTESSLTIATNTLPSGNYRLNIRQSSIGQFRDFGIDDICLEETTRSVLPIELLTFTGKAVEKQNVLMWTTTSEKKAAHFTIEQSADGKIFQALGTVKAVGKPAIAQDYVYFHEQPEKGVNYYRLKMVDLDGSFEYSNIVSIKRESDKEFSVQKLDNNLIFKGLEADTEVDIVLVDILGRIVFSQKNRSNTEGSLSQAIPDVAFGIYVASARSKQKVYSGKVLIENK